MNTIHPHHIEQLKSAVLNAAGISNMAPCDCRVVAAMIFNKTKQQLSETTVKRVFGFANSKFNPSLYTIDVMAAFCGYKSWTEFTEKASNHTKNAYTPAWNILKARADKVTNFTLQASKNRSGIPYANTISRKFMQMHIDLFLEGDYSATVFTSPTGYGKTISLCHWIDDRLHNGAATENNDIVLFFSSSAIINSFVSGRNTGDWLLDLLGYSAENDIPSVLMNAPNDGRKFILIIDGLDEHQFKPDQFQHLLEQLTNVFAFYQNNNQFKLIITMRMSSWTNYKHLLDEDKWFLGIHSDTTTPLINVPLFSVDELRQIIKNINADAKLPQDVKLINKFCYPLYLQFYYKNIRENFSLHYANHVAVNELIADFIINKVYRGNNSAEKILLLNTFIDEMRPDAGCLSVCKLKVNHLLKQYNSAYRELLGIGLLREINESEGLKYQISIQFMRNDFLEYMLARKLLHKNNYNFDIALVDSLNNLTQHNELKLPVLKWCLMYTIQNDNMNHLNAINNVELDTTERIELIKFVIELLKKDYQLTAKNDGLTSGVKHTVVNDLFGHHLVPELIEPCNEDLLLAFTGFNLSPAKRVTLYIALSLTAIIALDLVKLEKYIHQIKNEGKNHSAAYPINPVSCLESIFNYLKFGIIDRELIVKITKYIFKDVDTETQYPLQYETYLLILYFAARIYNNPYKEARLAKKLNEQYGSNNQYFNVIINTFTANRYITIGNIDKAITVFNELRKQTELTNTKTLGLAGILLQELELKIALITGDCMEQANAFDHYEQLTANGNYNMPKLLLLQFMLNVFRDSTLVNKHQKELSYQFSKMLIRLGISEAGLQSAKYLENVKLNLLKFKPATCNATMATYL